MQHVGPSSVSEQRAWSVAQYSLSHRVDPYLWRAWSTLARDAPPFLRPDFFALEVPLLGGAEPFALAAYRGDELAGVLPLLRRGRDLESLRSEETTEYDYVGEPEGLDEIWRHLVAMRDWDRLTLSGVPADSPLTYRLSEVALRDLAITVAQPSSRSPYLTLPGFEGRMPSKLRANLRRWRRKLGEVELERVTRFSHADLAEGLRIEAMAWKGAQGASISSRPELRHFYHALSRLASRAGELDLYFLRHAGRRIAFLFALEEGLSLYAMRVGYDPVFDKFGPGHLLFAEVARDAEARGLVELNFMGGDSEWKQRWTHVTHDHVVSVTYRPTVRGVAMLVGRELVSPRLSEDAKQRVRHARAQLARATRRCQRNDLIGVHSRAQEIQGRLRRGLGIRSGAKRLVSRPPASTRTLGGASRYEPGDWVRVRDPERIRATLDDRGKLRGLPFLDYQLETCGRIYRVQGRCRRLVDDHGQMRAVERTVLLDGVTCDAGHGLGCGRHCPMMYRDEWLEPVEAPAEAAAPEPEPEPVAYATVRSLPEIEATLDRQRRRDGLTFMTEMEAYAGRRLPVLRQIDHVHELERDTTARAPVFQLGGAVCTGADLGAYGPCDRQCPILWHGDWLHTAAS